MIETKLVKGIVRGYFFGALAASAMHIVTAFEKMGLHSGEQYAAPLLIDGIAIIGLLMRGADWSTNTRKIGLRVQVTMGTFSLAANVFAGSSLGGRIFGAGIVACFIFAEWLGDRMETRAAEIARNAEATEESKRAERNAKARNRRQASKNAQRSASRAEAARIRAAEKALATA